MYISQRLLQPSIITSTLWLIRENLKGLFIWWKPLWSCSFKGNYLFHKTSCSNICLKSVVLNVRKHLKPCHSFMMNKLIWQFHNSSSSYPKSFSFSKELLLRRSWFSFKVLKFLGRATVKKIYLKHNIFVKTIYFLQSTTCSRPFFKVMCHFIWKEKNWTTIHFVVVLASFGGSASAIHPFT